MHPLVKLYRRAKQANGHDFAQKAVQKLYAARYEHEPPEVAKYAARKPAAGQREMFPESTGGKDPEFEKKHPRGQPENAGEFATVASTQDSPINRKLTDTQTAEHPREAIEPLDTEDGGELMEGIPKQDQDAPEPDTAPRTPEELASIESALSTAKIVDGDVCPDKSANEVYFVKLENGQRGVFKPADKEFQNGRRDIPNNTLATREVAAYDIAKIIGLDDILPVTVMHTAHNSGQNGSMQEFCEGAEIARKIPGAKAYDGKRDAARAIVFDFIMGNTDRHSKNWMIDQGGKIRLIDNGFCLPEAHGLQTLKFMSQAQNQLAGHYFGLPLAEAKAEWEGKLPAVVDALKNAGISNKAIDTLKERYEIIMENADFGDAINALWGRQTR